MVDKEAKILLNLYDALDLLSPDDARQLAAKYDGTELLSSDATRIDAAAELAEDGEITSYTGITSEDAINYAYELSETLYGILCKQAEGGTG